jgi:beta-galactosidase
MKLISKMDAHFIAYKLIVVLTILLTLWSFSLANEKKNSTSGRIEFSGEFAPSEGFVRGPEIGIREELCLNGYWDFQPVYKPDEKVKTTSYGINASDVAADLPTATANGWDAVKIKIPSEWTSVEEYPSYPEAWRRAQMGWLRKDFEIPSGWDGKRIVLRFQAVGGDCKVFLNGERIGGNFDSTIPFEFDITDKVKKGSINEILVGTRSHSLFNTEGKYGRLAYAPGGSRMLGIWQDVYLLALPKVYVTDVYIKPEVSLGRLVAEVTIKNTTDEDQTVKVNSVVNEWVNLAGKDVLKAPEVKWKLGDQVLGVDLHEIKVPAGKEITATLEKKVSNELKYWDFDRPNLYGMTISLEQNGKSVDKKYERFGWREFKIEGKNFLLNGKSVQLLGDSQHLQNETYYSRRFAWSWFRLMKDVGANAARLHAVVWPGYIHDMADEMGIVLLSESSVYASSCDINYDSDLFWKSAKYNVEGMVRKYRNHPSVYGWSIENEVLPALNVKCNDVAYKKMVYDGMNGLADICRKLDSTRDWISGDGSRDMDGRLPVFNVHYGSTTSYKEDVANLNKPFGVGEACIAYYATPRQSEMYVGDRSYRSFKDHSDAIAIDAYELLKVERQICTYCSVWNLGYYAVEELPLGISDISKSPTKDEGVFFTGKYVEGKPGSQIERIPPYASQYNPGYDPNMPLYKPQPLYYAIKAAYHQPEPAPCEWDHREVFKNPVAPVIKNPEKEVLFAGEEGSDLYFKLKSMGIPLVMQSSTSKVFLVDCNTAKTDNTFAVKIKNIVAKGGQVIFWGLTPENQSSYERFLPYPVEVFERNATSLVPNENDNRVSSITYKDYYFTENTDSKTILKYALRGNFVDKGNILLKACPVDWARNINGGMMRSERENPEGPALVEMKEGKGAYLLSTINIEIVTPAHIRMITRLFSNLGVAVKPVPVKRGSLLDQTSVLTRTLIAGYYKASSFDEAFKKDFIGGETTLKPEYETKTSGCTWNVEESKTGFFDFNSLGIDNGSFKHGAVYLSFWLQCPQPLNEIMADPNVPVVNFNFSTAGAVKIWLNGEEKYSSAKPVEDGAIEKLPLKKGWNQFLVKVVKSGDEWNFKGRLNSQKTELLSEMSTALNPYSEKANFYRIMHTDPEIVYDHNWGLQGDGWYESATPGAKAVLNIYGTGVALTGLVFPNGGKAKIFIDGKFDKIVEYKRDFRDPHYLYYSKSGLPDGGHEITVEVVEGWVSVGPYEQWESFKSTK